MADNTQESVFTNMLPSHIRRVALKLMIEYKQNLHKYNEMHNYYIGNTYVKRHYPQTDRNNRIATTNFIKKFINEETSFSVGNPITYVSRTDNEKALEDIEYILGYQRGSLDSELMRNLLTYGTAYEFYYINTDGEFRCMSVGPLNGVAYTNLDSKAEIFLYYHQKDLDDNIYIDVYDSNYIYHCDSCLNVIAAPTRHYFKCCPVGVAKLPEGANDTLYNDLKLLQDNYELVLSDYSNEIGDTRMSYLVLTGLELDDEDAKKMKKMGILQIPTAEGKADWLIKNISPEFLKGILSIIEDKIYQISHHINHNVVMSSNTSGVALSSRLISLRNKIGINQKCLTDCIRTRLKCLGIFLDESENVNFDYKDILIKYTLNIPQDDQAMAQIITQLDGKLSAETGLSLLSFIQNGKVEYEKARKEKEAAAGFMTEDDIFPGSKETEEDQEKTNNEKVESSGQDE